MNHNLKHSGETLPGMPQDSVRMTPAEVFKRLGANPIHLEAHMRIWYEHREDFKNGAERPVYPHADRVKTEVQRQFDMNCNVAMRAVKDPCGIFYKYGLQDDGSYRWMGFRYGREHGEAMCWAY